MTLGVAFVALVAAMLGGRAEAQPPLQLVETFPIETSLDNEDLPEAHDIWLEMIESATTSLDFAEFYASNAADSRLEPIVQAIEAAAARGVRVRFLSEERFYSVYPETLERLGRTDGVRVSRYDTSLSTGGVLHAKYFIVDGRDAFVGSQNFDWRALTHIQELGLRVRVASVVAMLQYTFELDWSMTGGEAAPDAPPNADFPERVPSVQGTARVSPLFSPSGRLPDERLWDLPRILDLIRSAQRSVRIQLLSYRSVGRDGTYFPDLETALRSAAARGVQVQLLLSHWSKRAGTIEGLQSLQSVPNIDVKLATIPEWSGGFIPYARVIHAKYMVVDGESAWLGTSNWERDYFYASRNVGLSVTGGRVPDQLQRFFMKTWSSPYTERVDPCAQYEAPRIGE
jgi:phosphatidylserine/phosphatidylglycerophosphate/cardiolipin synthase-like enzyme